MKERIKERSSEIDKQPRKREGEGGVWLGRTVLFTVLTDKHLPGSQLHSDGSKR